MDHKTAIIEREIKEREVDGIKSHVGSVLIDLSTEFRLPGPADAELRRQQIQQAITIYYQSDDLIFNAYIGYLPEDDNAYSSLSRLRLIVPFIADADTRRGFVEQHKMLPTFSKRLWDLRKDPTVLIRRYNVVDRKKTCLNTFRVRLNRTNDCPDDQQADLYVLGLHGNGTNAHAMLGNTLSVATRLIKTNKSPVKAIEIISFDYRGSIASPGSHDGIDDLADQAMDQVLDLIQQGISPDKIVLHGHSLGGLVGVIAANKLMKAGHIVHYFGDRPPNSVSDFAAAAAGSLSSILSRPARFFSNSMFPEYQCDGAELYLQLPKTHRACLASKKDEVVLFDGSLVRILQSRHKNNEGIVVEEMVHMTPIGNLGIYGDHYNPEENPLFQFLLQRLTLNIATSLDLQ